MTPWDSLDTMLAGTAAACAMACAVPGVFLMLRRQSMMADALSHTALPGVVLAFLLSHELEHRGVLPDGPGLAGARWAFLMGGATLAGVLTAYLTEAVRRLGRVEAGAALGVVYTALFAFGLLILRRFADSVHIEPSCVLFGEVEQTVLNTTVVLGHEVPWAAVTGLAALAAGAGLAVLFRRHLAVATFDPGLAAAGGVSPRAVNDLLMAFTAVVLVTVFQSVGSILAIAMLVTPAAAARCCTDRLGRVLWVAACVAAAGAFLGHLGSRTLVPALAGPLGLDRVKDAGTAGPAAAATGGLFLLCALFGPARGVLVTRWRARTRRPSPAHSPADSDPAAGPAAAGTLPA